jgi:uncharacterized protein (TIGR02757 family)
MFVMQNRNKDLLKMWAKEYHQVAFIANDPIQFPHRFTEKQDIEISAFVTSYLSFGNRKQIIKKVDHLHDMMGDSPEEYVRKGSFFNDIPNNDSSFYRTISNKAILELFATLRDIYDQVQSMEEALKRSNGIPMERLCRLFSVSSKSPQKKMNMFLRWMIRGNSPVDFGLWNHFDARDLIIPLDTHVVQMSYQLGLTDTTSYTLKNALRITEALTKVFPEDPCLGDFALFGYGVNHA